MKAYGLPRKMRFNYTDYHPKRLGKNVVNWWEAEIGKVIKKRERQSARKEINKIINEETLRE